MPVYVSRRHLTFCVLSRCQPVRWPTDPGCSSRRNSGGYLHSGEKPFARQIPQKHPTEDLENTEVTHSREFIILKLLEVISSSCSTVFRRKIALLVALQCPLCAVRRPVFVFITHLSDKFVDQFFSMYSLHAIYLIFIFTNLVH